MLIVMSPNTTASELEAVTTRITSLGLTPHPIPGAERVAIGITGNHGPIDAERFADLPGVTTVVPVTQPFKLVSREVQPEPTVVTVAGVPIGGTGVAVIAGPCAVESADQLFRAADAVASTGAHLLRGGAYKPRTSPYDFQGLREEGLLLLAEARARTGLGIVTEAKDTTSLALVAEIADMVQIGARNMQNFSLLEQVGSLDKPVLLKRGMSATITELLMAAEYIVSRGNRNVVLCERGIRTFETRTRNTLDINAIPVLHQLTHLPVIADPSHAIGIRSHVSDVAGAAVAAGADGLIVEVHPAPETALSDGRQSLDPGGFAELYDRAERIALAVNRRMCPQPHDGLTGCPVCDRNRNLADADHHAIGTTLQTTGTAHDQTHAGHRRRVHAVRSTV